ncbi:hypothetical protein IE4872_PD01532 (plasmid) [Rhizobium gallicum]|uniref:Uncharacterized protein n=1 Tax=Rhizobium gallicum TaxID=56730 RepID=A0A1L5NVW2_9HYPH|nr:hypothetical protein IE4872_PD01532 [Rhizobium gallicum]
MQGANAQVAFCLQTGGASQPRGMTLEVWTPTHGAIWPATLIRLFHKALRVHLIRTQERWPF